MKQELLTDEEESFLLCLWNIIVSYKLIFSSLGFRALLTSAIAISFFTPMGIQTRTELLDMGES